MKKKHIIILIIFSLCVAVVVVSSLEMQLGFVPFEEASALMHSYELEVMAVLFLLFY